MSEWLFVLLLTLPLVALAWFDVRVARKLHQAAAIRPQSTFLSLVSWVVNGVAIGIVSGAVLGINSVVFVLTGLRILQMPLPTVLIYVAVIAGSVALLPLSRQIGRWEREIPPDPNHRFGTDQ